MFYRNLVLILLKDQFDLNIYLSIYFEKVFQFNMYFMYICYMCLHKQVHEGNF